MCAKPAATTSLSVIKAHKMGWLPSESETIPAEIHRLGNAIAPAVPADVTPNGDRRHRLLANEDVSLRHRTDALLKSALQCLGGTP